MREDHLNYCANGHVMEILGGTNCGCYPDASCSVPVYSCRECGDSDYGDNTHAQLVKRMCSEARECKTQGSFYERLPPLHLTKAEFEALDEYSATHPTGSRPGKRWRRHDGAYDRSCKKAVWIIGEFVEKEIESGPYKGQKGTFISWSIPVIRLDAPLTGV